MPDNPEARSPEKQFAQRRLENLEFFSRHYPSIFAYFKDYVLTKAEVVIIPTDNEVDLWLNGQSLYNGQGRLRGRQGVELFRSTFKSGSRLGSLPPPWPGDYCHPRFAHRAVDNVVRSSPLKRCDFSGYPVPQFYPLVVFQGVGLGYHIEELVKQCEVENAVILEPDVEVFAASLFTVNWANICLNFGKKGRSLRFLIGAELTEEALWPPLITQLMQFCPIFPVMNLFINERGDSVMASVAERLNREALTSLTTWGHYDDEIRQINNALHAFHEGVQIIPPRDSVNSDVPVLIVGSGPSIDGRLGDIRAARDRVVVVSAGTGLRALLENEIFPDFHVELESDYLNYRVLSSLDRAKLKKTRIVAASQICPLIWGLFGDQRLYYKLESPIAGLFGSERHTIKSGTPTCTNAAIAICTQLGLKNIFLFGTDFGFRSHEKHHASQSVYMKSRDENDDTELTSVLEDSARTSFSKRNTFTVEGVDGKTVNTTPIYFTARRTVEILIQDTLAKQPDTRFRNCSDGARISGAEWQDSDDFLSAVELTGSEAERARVNALIFSGNAATVSTTDIETKLQSVEEKLKQLSAYADKLCQSQRLRGKQDMTRLVSEMARYMESSLAKDEPSFYYMIRGTIRHFLYAGFAHAIAIENNTQAAKFLQSWREGFLGCLNHLPKHFRTVTHKTYSLKQDPWVRQSINDPEEPEAEKAGS